MYYAVNTAETAVDDRSRVELQPIILDSVAVLLFVMSVETVICNSLFVAMFLCVANIQYNTI